MKTQELLSLWQPKVLIQDHSDSEEFNRQLATEVKAFVTENFKDREFYFSTPKHDVSQYLSPGIQQRFRKMIYNAVRQYCWAVYGNEPFEVPKFHTAAIWGEGDFGRTGVPAHVHANMDLVATYYPEVDTQGITDRNHAGNVRFYDQNNSRHDFIENKNPDTFSHMWCPLEVQSGTLVVFPGTLLHDSSFFEGPNRVCMASLVRFPRPTDEMSWCGLYHPDRLEDDDV